MDQSLSALHEKTYKQTPQASYFAPGVVNLLGTFTEEEGGKVISLTHSIGLKGLVSPRTDRTIQLYLQADSADAPNVLSIALETLEYDAARSHGKLLVGLLRKLAHEGYDVSKGMNITIGGTLTKDMGLGFESSLLMLMMTLLLDQNAIRMDTQKQFRYSYHVIKNIKPLASTPVDPLTLLHSQKDHLLYVDSKTFEYEAFPFDFKTYTWVLFSTNRNPEHSLKSILKRKQDVKEAFQAINRTRSIETLCDLSISAFNALKALITKSMAKKRVEHVVFENDRAIQGKEAINRGDCTLFSGIINQSHTSLRELYEVSTEELDFLSKEMAKHGALASKLIGVGYGGTLIALFERDSLPEDFSDLLHRYQKRFHKALGVQTLKSDSTVRKNNA